MAKPIRPTKYPRWASELVKDEIYHQFNIHEPPENKKDIGWVVGESPPSQWLNWLTNTTCKWIDYLAHQVNHPEEFEKLKLPDACLNKGRLVFVSDVDGGVLSFSNGINWKKIKIEGNI